jgi:hypothetical protein
MNKPLLALLTTFICAFGSPSALAMQTDASAKPPLDGQYLQFLLGQRAESAKVAAMCAWAGAPAPDWQTETVSGKGMRLTFVDSRVKEIRLRIAPNGSKPSWPGELPMELSRSSKKGDLNQFNSWTGEYDSEGNRSNSRYRRIQMTRSFGDHELAGYEGFVSFNTIDRISYLTMEVSPEWYWYQYSKAIQEMVPASEFTADKWIGMLGTDIGSDNGDVLAAWAGMPVAGPSCKRAGLALELAENRWIDTITLDSTFEGSFPFGLTANLTIEGISALFGEGIVDSENPSQLNWMLTSARYWPIHIEFNDSNPDALTFTLRCERSEVNAFYTMLAAEGEPSEALVADIIKVWNAARNKPESLKGRLEVTEGVFGPISTWVTPIQLGGVMNGTLQENEGVVGDALHRVEFMLRFYNGDPAKAAEQLSVFAKALKGSIEGTGDPEPYEATNKKSSGLRWTTDPDDVFGSKPQLRIEARMTEAGSELYLLISAPV